MKMVIVSNVMGYVMLVLISGQTEKWRTQTSDVTDRGIPLPLGDPLA